MKDKNMADVAKTRIPDSESLDPVSVSDSPEKDSTKDKKKRKKNKHQDGHGEKDAMSKEQRQKEKKERKERRAAKKHKSGKEKRKVTSASPSPPPSISKLTTKPGDSSKQQPGSPLPSFRLVDQDYGYDRSPSPSWTSSAELIPSAAEQLHNQLEVEIEQASHLMRPPRIPERKGNLQKPSSSSGGSSGIGAPNVPESSSGLTVEELSIEETNKVRAALGLKPLQVAGAKATSAEGAAKKQEDVHAPPVNISEVKKTEKIKEKLKIVKEKRELENKIRTVKTLGEASDEDESVESWVEKNRRLVEEKRKAELRAKVQEEMDNAADEDEGGMPTPSRGHPAVRYSAEDLRGLKVEHDVSEFREGQDMILTLKDADVLDEQEQDVLVSSVLTEEEKLKKNIENRKKKPTYNPYENADDFDAFGAINEAKVLKKYDEVIDGDRKKTFVLDVGGKHETGPESASATKTRVHLGQMQDLLSLSTQQTLAKEYYNEEEMAAKFKKVKRSKNVKSRKMEQEKESPPKTTGSIIVDDDMDGRQRSRRSAIDDEDDDVELQLALNRSRKLKQQASLRAPSSSHVAEISKTDSEFLHPVKTESDDEDGGAEERRLGPGKNVFLDETSEFCRAVGIQGLPIVKVNKEEVDMAPGYADSGTALGSEYNLEEPMDMELDDIGMSEERKGGWSEVQFEAEPANLGSDEEDGSSRKTSKSRALHGSSQTKYVVRSILDDEPTCDRGVGAALQLAVKKGLIDQYQESKRQQFVGRGKNSSIPIQTYTIEDKIIDDDKRGRHDRYQGPTVPFKEKPGYKPGFQLEYHDATGRTMDAKEAFRDLSHKFHGKGPGKLKTERRTKKHQEEKLLMEMSSVDTPLHTVEKMMQKQQELQTPYILLSGVAAATSKGPTPISKKQTNM